MKKSSRVLQLTCEMHQILLALYFKQEVRQLRVYAPVHTHLYSSMYKNVSLVEYTLLATIGDAAP